MGQLFFWKCKWGLVYMMNDLRNIPQWNHTTKQLVGATLVVLAGLFIYLFRALLPPVIIAALLAYILAPVVGWLSRVLHISRGWATGLLYLLGIALLAVAPAISVTAIVDEINNLELNFTSIVNHAIGWIEQFNAMEIAFAGYVFVLPEIDIPTFDFQQIINLLQDTVSTVAGGAVSVATTVVTGVGWMMFIAIVAFYMIADADRIGSAMLHVAPPAYRQEIAQLGQRINKTWNAFLRGQIILCFTIGTMTWLAMTAVGTQYSLALGIVAGILEVIPSFGPFLAAIPAVLIALVQGSMYINLPNWGFALLVAGIYWLIQSLENNLLVPRIIGATLNLHPLIIIIGVLAGATLANILGVFLAAPVLASLRDIVHYLYCKLADIDPFPPPPPFAQLLRERDIQAFLFDLDGTLLDSDDMTVEQWATRLRPAAFVDKIYDSNRLARRLIMFLETPINLAITILDMLGLDAALFSMSEWLRKASAQQAPQRYVCVDGTVELIKELSKTHQLGIVTTRNRDDAHQFLVKFGLQDTFDVIVTRQDVRRLKPHPEPIRYAARQLGCSPKQCVMVGDTTVDIQAGKRAGALTVAVLCGFGERPELERLKPSLLLDTTTLLARHLDQAG